MKKTAVIQCPDSGPLESLVIMLRAVGYRCLLTGQAILDRLRAVGCDVVVPGGNAALVRGMGYERPFPRDAGALGDADLRDMDRCDLYVDIKAHKNYTTLCQQWPNLAGRVLWYRINGAAPEHVVNARGDHGDEVNQPCPVLTPNLWYATSGPWSNRAYACWPPFYRAGEYYPKRGRSCEQADWPMQPPVCLIHGITGWGYGALLPGVRALGVRCYGAGSPDGLVPHHDVPNLLSNSACMVHLKSNDAPGYALLEALAAACPVVCTRRLIWRCRMQDLLVPGETCLVFDRETHEGLTEADVADCLRELGEHLVRLRDPAENLRIGLQGQQRLRDIMWDDAKAVDVASLRAFMEAHFP